MSITTTAAREAVYERFRVEWGTTTPYTLDNEKFDPPVGIPWVRLSMRHNLSEQETLGPIGLRKFMRSGIIFLQIFTPEDSGQRASDVLVDAAKAIFEGVSLSSNNIRIYSGTIRELGVDDDRLNVVLMEFPFQYDERR